MVSIDRNSRGPSGVQSSPFFTVLSGSVDEPSATINPKRRVKLQKPINYLVSSMVDEGAAATLFEEELQ
jgi:hypothetical protein